MPQAGRSGGEAFAAGAMRDRIRVGNFKTALLQVVTEIEDRPADEQRALGIDHHPDVRCLDKDVAVGRAIDQIHFVLQPGATTADHRHAQRAVGPALFLQERSQLERRALGHLDEAFISDLVIDG